jgi:2-hydroxy-3-oxopropionate reductase
MGGNAVKQTRADTVGSVAFLGIGLMGERQARRLLAAGYRVVAWNRTIEKSRRLEADGAEVAVTAAEAVRMADFVITMLENGSAVEAVLFGSGAAAAMRPGTIVLDMSSIGPDEARTCAERLRERGVEHLDAPVSGGTAGAEQGTLAIMCGGDEAVFHRAMPVLGAVGLPTRVGPHGAGQLAKLANQIIVGAAIGAVAEALLLVRRGGADPARVIEALRGGFADSQILQVHGARMVAGDYQTRGRSATHLKDLNNALAAAAETRSPVPYAELTADLFRELLREDGDLDHSGLMRELERRAAA